MGGSLHPSNSMPSVNSDNISIKTEPGLSEPRGPSSGGSMPSIKLDPDKVKIEPNDMKIKQEATDQADVKDIKFKAKKSFHPDHLRNSLMPVWDKLERMDEAIPFRVPVDPELCHPDIHKQAVEDNLKTPCQLPYFDGDFWPNVVEDCIREADDEEAERRREMEMQAIFDIGGSQGKKKKRNIKKKNQKTKGTSKNKKKGGPGSGNDMVDKLYANMEKHKEVFFTIRLASVQSANQKMEIKDPDPILNSELMDGRDTFLQRARDDHWEFSSLRRAKYSTMCLCHALHSQGKEALEQYTCNSCQSTSAPSYYHCPTCDVSLVSV